MKNLALLALLCAACGGSSKHADGGAVDLAGLPDLGSSDLSTIDQAVDDLSMEDQSVADLSMTDLTHPPDLTLVCADGGTICSGACYDTTDDVNHCGGCGIACSAPHATPACTSSLCAIGSCSTGYMDCDSTYADGCETHVAADPKHCGTCSTVCTKNNACVSSSCMAVTLDFTEPPTDYAFPSNSRPSAVVAGDFDNDGKLDLYGVTANSGDTRMFLGDGMGGIKKTISGSLGQYLGAKSGDLDHDGKLDVVVATYYGVDVIFGKGDGTFGAPVVYGNSMAGHSPDGVALGDVDGDGYLDVVYPDYTNDTVYVQLNDKTGALQAATGIPTGQSGGHASAVVLADFNHDLKLDYAVASENTGNVGVFLGDGTGHFSSSATVSVGSPNSLAAGDIDGDGVLDLVAGAGSSQHALFLGVGNGTFSMPFAFTTPGGTGGVALGDLNGDGITDVVMANVVDTADANGRRTVTVFLGSGDATAPLQYTNPAPTDLTGVFRDGASPAAPIVVDWNADGRLDIVTANGNSGDTVDVLLNATM